MKNDKLVSVQALRGLAAIAVMLFHFRWNLNLHHQNLGDKLIGWGGLGVDLFFVISGFVITLSAQKVCPGIPNAFKFLKRRAIRILPAYFIILLFSFLLSGGMSTFHYPEKVSNLISAFTFTLTEINHAPFYINDSAMYGIRWTLNYELFFYVLVSLCLFTTLRWQLLFCSIIFLLVVMPIINLQLPTLSVKGYHFNCIYLRLATNPIIWTFLTGVLIGLFYPYTKHFNNCIRKSFLILSVMITIYFFGYTPYIGHGMDMSGGVLSLLFLAIILNDNFLSKYIPNWLDVLGELSFSLYLVHTLMNESIGRRFNDFGISDGIPRFIASCIASIALAYLCYRYIDSPFAKKKTKIVKPAGI